MSIRYAAAQEQKDVARLLRKFGHTPQPYTKFRRGEGSYRPGNAGAHDYIPLPVRNPAANVSSKVSTPKPIPPSLLP